MLKLIIIVLLYLSTICAECTVDDNKYIPDYTAIKVGDQLILNSYVEHKCLQIVRQRGVYAKVLDSKECNDIFTTVVELIGVYYSIRIIDDGQITTIPVVNINQDTYYKCCANKTEDIDYCGIDYDSPQTSQYKFLDHEDSSKYCVSWLYRYYRVSDNKDIYDSKNYITLSSYILDNLD